MALVLGVSAGFVTEAPVADPSDSNTAVDGEANAIKDTAPATGTVTEIGWWCDTATEEANFEVGLYSDEDTYYPLTLLGSDKTNAKGTDAGWKRVTGLDISITADTVYWIAFQLDDTATTTNANYFEPGQIGYVKTTSTLPDPTWGDEGPPGYYPVGIYAVWEAAAPENINPKVKIAGTFATKKTLVKIGGTFVEKPVLVKVSGTFQ